jgi:hypothetical protein
MCDAAREAVPGSRYGLDIPGVSDGFTKALANCRDIHREDTLFHGDVTPDQVEKLAFGDKCAGAPDQRDEHIECLWRERHYVAPVTQPTLLDVQQVRPKFVHSAGSSHGLAES